MHESQPTFIEFQLHTYYYIAIFNTSNDLLLRIFSILQKKKIINKMKQITANGKFAKKLHNIFVSIMFL